MNTRNFIITAALVLPLGLTAQERWTARTGTVTFNSTTPLENIDAKNTKASSVFDATTNDFVFVVLIRSFEFEKALMQEHFNENYMESTKFPKATFKGKVSGLKAGALSAAGTYNVTVTGEMTMHGVTKTITTTGVFTVDAAGKVSASCDFLVKPEDYEIKIPGMVKDNIAKDINVHVRMEYVRS